MPHIAIKCFPRDLSEQDKQALADALTQVMVTHLQSKPDSVSIAMTEVSPDDWKETVWKDDIEPQLETLLKQPGYRL